MTPDQRRVAKVLNFGIAYGLSAFGLSQRLDMPPREAQGIIDRYFARYAGVKRWLEEIVAEARRTGEVRTLFGRLRPMPEIAARNPALRQAAERTAVNTPDPGDGRRRDQDGDAEGAGGAGAGAARRPACCCRSTTSWWWRRRSGRWSRSRRCCGARWRRSASLAVPLLVEVGHGRSWAEAH